MSNWQPISTAPLDGTAVDLWVIREYGGGRYAECTFDNGHWNSMEFNDLNFDYFKPNDQITHWMPLPEPPND